MVLLFLENSGINPNFVMVTAPSIFYDFSLQNDSFKTLRSPNDYNSEAVSIKSERSPLQKLIFPRMQNPHLIGRKVYSQSLTNPEYIAYIISFPGGIILPLLP